MESTRSGCFGARLDQRADSGWKLPATFARLLSSHRSEDQCSALPRAAGLPCQPGWGVPLPSSGASGKRERGWLALLEVLASSAPKRERASGGSSPQGNHLHQPRALSPNKWAEHPEHPGLQGGLSRPQGLRGPGTFTAGGKSLLQAKQAAGAGRNKKALPGRGLCSARETRTLDRVPKAFQPQQRWPDPTLPS